MGDFGLGGWGSDTLEEGFDYSNTRGTAVTSGAADTLGSWVELVSAANNDRASTGIIVHIWSEGGNQAESLVNIALGAAASETAIISNLFVPTSSSSGGIAPYKFYFPISIPKGQRISANCQNAGATQTMYVHIQLVRGNLNDSVQGSGVDTVGAATGTTDGITVNAAGTVNTFGSWTEIVSSSTEAYKGIVVAAFKIGGSYTNMKETYDIGIGAGGSEEIIVSGHFLVPNSFEHANHVVSDFIPVQIPEGTRIAARVQADSTNADAHLDFIIYGVR